MDDGVPTIVKTAQHPEPDSASRYRISFLDPQEIDSRPDILERWKQLSLASDYLYALYQSPAWWDYLLPPQDGQRYSLGVVRSVDGAMIAAVPLRIGIRPLEFAICGRRLAKMSVRAAAILGNQPNMPDEEMLYAELLRAIFRNFPDCDCIDLGSVMVGSYCWSMVSHSPIIRQTASIRIRESTTPHYYIELPESFEQYQIKFKSKTRYNLKREVNRLRERGGGRLGLVRIERAEDVNRFLTEAATISQNSWQYRELGVEIENTCDERQKFAQLAESGVLRSYLLQCGEEYCAFVRGFQYENTYYYSWCGFDGRLAEYSPGKVLLFLLIEDLCNHRRPKRLTFLWGGAPYKDIFGTGCFQDASVLLIRKKGRLPSRLRFGAHSAFESVLWAFKHCLPRKISPESARTA